MLLTITTTHTPATDLGYLLHKHPARAQSFDLSFGRAHVFYPEAAQERCTAAMVLDLDAIGLKRHRKALVDYVTDRPYVASSFTSVAIARVFGTALKGQCAHRPDLVTRPIPLRAKIHVLPCRGGDQLLCDLFQPLGYAVTAKAHRLDEKFSEWGHSPYYTVALEARIPLKDLLTHLYVLIPVLDNDKHYFVSQSEIDTLMRRGKGWLSDHPKRDLIVDRYLKHQRTLTREAFRLMDDIPLERGIADSELVVENNLRLNQQRYRAASEALEKSGAQSILDLGCGEGRFAQILSDHPQFTKILGMEVSHRALSRAKERRDRLPPVQRDRIELIHGSLFYRDARLEGYDAAVLLEVIEHLALSRLPVFNRVVFEYARPNTVIVTTPNAEFNVRWASLPGGRFRHPDHRFEWSRKQFQNWARGVAEKFNYRTTFKPIGPVDPEVGPPTQMAVFTDQAVTGDR